MYKTIDQFMDYVILKNPGENEFHQAVKEVVGSIWDFLQDNQHYLHDIVFGATIGTAFAYAFFNDQDKKKDKTTYMIMPVNNGYVYSINFRF